MDAKLLMPGRERLYAIGDIHGRADLLDRMIELISGDLDAKPAADPLIVTIGDYVDRGPDSRGVVERLVRNPFPGDFVALKGNHEELIEAFLRDPATAGDWRRFGGVETLHSYGVDVGGVMRGKDYEAAAAALREAVPQAHLGFLASLVTSVVVGRYFLCHAGIRPGVPLAQQRDEDLLWIRDPFLASTADFVAGGSTAGPSRLPPHSPVRWRCRESGCGGWARKGVPGWHETSHGTGPQMTCLMSIDGWRSRASGLVPSDWAENSASGSRCSTRSVR
jgi:serine/threonine protein phosphatase 1